MLLVEVLFVMAGLCEIGGGYLVWGWMLDHRPLAWTLVGAAVLALYGVVAALQPIPEFGRVYAPTAGSSSPWPSPGASSSTASVPTATTCSEP